MKKTLFLMTVLVVLFFSQMNWSLDVSTLVMTEGKCTTTGNQMSCSNQYAKDYCPAQGRTDTSNQDELVEVWNTMFDRFLIW